MTRMMDGWNSHPRRPPRILRGLLVFAFAAAITMVNQYWVGNATIYQKGLQERRAALHNTILQNHPESWAAEGANGVNIRVGAIYIAELVRRASGWDLRLTYRLLGAVYLLTDVLLLFWFLRLTSGPLGAVLGALYFGAILPITFFLYFFHPWDRLSLIFWLLALIALFKDRVWVFFVVILIGIPVKYDIIVLPGLYFLVKASPRDWMKPAVYTSAMLVVTFAVYVLLRTFLPGGFGAGATILDQIGKNLRDFLVDPLVYPPLLTFAVPLLLSMVGLPRSTRWERACFAFSLMLLCIIFLRANFQEARALMPMLVLMLPLALRGMSRFVDGLGLPSASPSLDEVEAAAESASPS